MTMKHFNLILVALIASAFFFNACKKEKIDDPNKYEDAFADVFVKKMKTPQGDKYGLVFYAGGQGLSSCKATAPDGTKYELKEYWKGDGNMRRHPKKNEMKGSMPQAGEYSFELKFKDGGSKTITDNLQDTEVPAITGVNVTHDAGTEAVSVTWNEVSGADAYIVKLTDKFKNEKKPIFVNKTLPKTATSYSFDKNTDATPGWMQNGLPQAGDTSYVMVVALKFEKDFKKETKFQNKQMNTVKPTMIVW